MENKNKAEELAKKLGDKFAAYSILPKAEQRGFLIAYRLLEDEIDELTKEKSLFIEKYTKSCDEVQKLEKKIDELSEVLKLSEANYVGKNAELTKEVEMLRKEREWISVFRSDIKPPINTPILCKQKATNEIFTYLILGMDENGEFRDFSNEDYIDSESELYSKGHYPHIEYWQPLPPLNQ